MATVHSVPCSDCGTELGSKAARSEHQRICPVRQSTELRRTQEQLEWQRARIARFIDEGYRNAARALAAYLKGQTETAHRMHGWLAEDFAERLRDIEQLSDAASAAQRTYYPRLSRLLTDVQLHIEQMKELAELLTTLNRQYGERS